jgi:hypothetical protein
MEGPKHVTSPGVVHHGSDMRARILQKTHRLRHTPARRGPELLDRPAEAADAASEPVDPEARVREAGGPEDRAQYACSCGMVFLAFVSTSVACPHCGTGQAW